MGVPPQAIPGLVSLVNVKANLTPAAADREWFRLRGVTLPNADPARGYVHGDQVQAIESYTPGSGGPLFPAATLRTVASVLAQGVNGEPYSPSPQPGRNYTGAVAAALRPLFGNAPDAQLATLARKAVAELESQGAIRIDERTFGRNRNRRKAIIVDKASPLFDSPLDGPFAEAR